MVPNSNYFYVHKEGLRNGKGQVERAAELIRGVRDFRDLVVEEKIEPEKVKGKALASSSYKQLCVVLVLLHPSDLVYHSLTLAVFFFLSLLFDTPFLSSFGASRVPATPADIPLTYPPSQAEHVIVLRKNRFYKIDTRGRGSKELERALNKVVEMSDKDGEGLGLGALTSENRDVWTEVSSIYSSYR